MTMQVTGIAVQWATCKSKDKSNERRQNAHLIFIFTRKKFQVGQYTSPLEQAICFTQPSQKLGKKHTAQLTFYPKRKLIVFSKKGTKTGHTYIPQIVSSGSTTVITKSLYFTGRDSEL